MFDKAAYMERYRRENKDRIARVHKAYLVKWNSDNVEKKREHGRRAANKYRRKNLDLMRAKWREYYYNGFSQRKRYMNESIKYETMCAYGKDGLAQCIACGIHDIDVLTIDHINNDGAKERKSLKIEGGVYFYKVLKQRGYPSGYQVLCMNCNLKKEITNRRTLLKARFKEVA